MRALKYRCTGKSPSRKYRKAIPKELRQKLSYTHALSFQYKRTGDAKLKLRIKEPRKENKKELTSVHALKLDKAIQNGNT